MVKMNEFSTRHVDEISHSMTNSIAVHANGNPTRLIHSPAMQFQKINVSNTHLAPLGRMEIQINSLGHVLNSSYLCC